MDTTLPKTFDTFFETPLWLQIWEQKIVHIAFFSLFLVVIGMIMLFKDRIARNRTVLNRIKYVTLGISFVYVGLVLKAQPTTTNIIIIVNSLKGLTFPIKELYLLEPFIFLSFVFIVLTLALWGRGVFCGWLCPYGAMVELLNALRDRFIPRMRKELPDRVHRKLIYMKYMVFFVILGTSFVSFMLSEYLTEVEPFRTFVLKMNRAWYFNVYFLILTVGSVIVYRGFCRYLCPLGAALAVPSIVKRIPLIKLKRYDLCRSCTICAKGCDPGAITAQGIIDSKECLNCLDCQVNFWDEDVCPALIREKKREHHSVKDDTSSRHLAAVGAVLFLFTTVIISFPGPVAGATLNVGDDYRTISAALDNADNGDTIVVRGGVHKGYVKIDKAVHLKGVDDPVISVDKGHILDVTSPDVVIEGFTFRYEGSDPGSSDTAIFIAKTGDRTIVRNNRFRNVMFGIWNVEGSDITIADNIIQGIKGLDRNNRGNCVNLTGTRNATVTGNRLSYCRDGIYMELCHDADVSGNAISDSRYSVHTMWVDRGTFNDNTVHDNLVGLAIMYTKHSEIRRNLAYRNQTHGLLLIQTVRSTVLANTVVANTKGIFLYNSILNRVYGNLLMHNQLGMHSWGGSEENIITGNSFMENEIQVKFVASRNQQWNNNYWSDYIGWDMTGDSIGDFSYESNSIVDHILWRYPEAKVLFSSPSLQILWMLEKQFPVLEVPRVVDSEPSMYPFHTDWKELKAKYAADPARYYGEIEKLPHLPGGGF